MCRTVFASWHGWEAVGGSRAVHCEHLHEGEELDIFLALRYFFLCTARTRRCAGVGWHWATGENFIIHMRNWRARATHTQGASIVAQCCAYCGYDLRVMYTGGNLQLVAALWASPESGSSPGSLILLQHVGACRRPPTEGLAVPCSDPHLLSGGLCISTHQAFKSQRLCFL